jgi:phosphatidate cytidylyltransferase
LKSDDDNLFGPLEADDAPTLGVSITGAHRVGAQEPESPDAPPAESSFEMPHWTDEPTGVVPAILQAETQAKDDPWASVPAPTWREESSDWVAEEEVFDMGMLLDDEPPSAVTDEASAPASQPWDFDFSESSADEGAVPETAAGAKPWDFDDLDDLLAGAGSGASSQGTSSEESYGDEDDAMPRAGFERERPNRRRAPRPIRPSRPDRDEPKPRDRNMLTAIVTGAVILALVLVTFDLGTVLAMALVLVVVTLAAAETYAAFRRGGQQPATLIGLVATVGLLLGVYNRGAQSFALIAVLLFAFTGLWFLSGVEKADTLTGLSSTMLVFVWVSTCGSFAALLLNPNEFPNRHGLAYLLAAIIVTAVYDTSCLFIGRAIGKRKLSVISPNKTWEGLIGGSVVVVLFSAIVIPLMHPWTESSAIVLGIVVMIVAPLGDLTESLIKRSLNLKDMGRLLPGHGGMLDRVDGLLFVLPATYYLVKAFHLG